MKKYKQRCLLNEQTGIHICWKCVLNSLEKPSRVTAIKLSPQRKILFSQCIIKNLERNIHRTCSELEQHLLKKHLTEVNEVKLPGLMTSRNRLQRPKPFKLSSDIAAHPNKRLQLKDNSAHCCSTLSPTV